MMPRRPTVAILSRPSPRQIRMQWPSVRVAHIRVWPPSMALPNAGAAAVRDNLEQIRTPLLWIMAQMIVIQQSVQRATAKNRRHWCNGLLEIQQTVLSAQRPATSTAFLKTGSVPAERRISDVPDPSQPRDNFSGRTSPLTENFFRLIFTNSRL